MAIDFLTSSIDLRRGSKASSNKFLDSSVVRPPIMVHRTTYNAKKEEKGGKRSFDKLNLL